MALTELTKRRQEKIKIFVGEWDEATYSRRLVKREYKIPVHARNENSFEFSENATKAIIDDAKNYTETEDTEYMARILGYEEVK